jgi:hypothetical protein
MGYVGMTKEGGDFLNRLDLVEDEFLSPEEVGLGIVDVLTKGSSGSVWYHHKRGDEPFEVEELGTWENLMKNKK